MSSVTTKRKFENVQLDAIFDAYKKHLFFHGTSTTSAADIRKHGMSLDRKVKGATSLMENQYGLQDKAARAFNYVMSLKQAACYAKMQSGPEIVRMVLPPRKFTLQNDPEAVSEEEFRTAHKIRKKFILPKLPDDLHRKQLRKINEAFRFPQLSRDELSKLQKRVREEIISKQSQDPDVIGQATSFLEQEAKRDQTTKKILQERGIDLSQLKEGEAISLSLD